MRLSRRSEYGLRALIDLVRHDADGPIALAVLAERNRLPPKFLEQIMATLKHGGVVRTSLGSHGGFSLAPGASQVSLSRIIRLLDGALAPVGCASLLFYEACSCPDEATCALREVMIEVRDQMLSVLDAETLGQLAARRGTPLLDPHHVHPQAVRTG
ncbi:MAG: RrF2 family transcriptional regulator [Candidatus Limnocylindrales bacterium]